MGEAIDVHFSHLHSLSILILTHTTPILLAW